MSKILYLNNYKGFFNTYIPLESVNFLVGENSSGKTNILKLLNFLSDSFFVMTNNFNINSFDLGTFNDIVCQNNNYEKKFEIAFMIDGDKYKSLYLKYREENNVPMLEHIRVFSNDKDLSVLIDEKTIKYRLTEDKSKKGKDYFINWIESKENTDEHDVVKFGNKKDEGLILFKIFSILRADYKKKHENDAFFDFFDIPSLFNSYSLSAPIRNKPQKVYSDFSAQISPEGNHSPYVLSKILDNKTRNKDVINEINKFGIKSGIFDSLSVEKYKDKALEIIVRINKNKFNIANVGYGVSQILPILIDVAFRSKDHVMAIQQPEVHLHPKAQAAFGEILYLFAKKDNKSFFIETHSDYMIDRFRYAIKNSKGRNQISSQILFFEKKQDRNVVYNIIIKNNGTYADAQPESFRKFFINEELMKFEL